MAEDNLPVPAPAPHVDASITVKQQSEDLTGIAKVDACIKIVKYLGFPIAAAVFLLYMFNGLINDYRGYIKESAGAQTITAEAVVKSTETQASTTRALWQLKQGQDESHRLSEGIQGILKDSKDVLESVLTEQKRAAEILDARKDTSTGAIQ